MIAEISDLDGFIYSGVAAGIVSALVTVLLNYWFQKRLLAQQLEFQQCLLDQQLAASEKGHKEYLAFLEKAAHWDYVRGENLRTTIADKKE
jgi:hypothetical protein